MHAHLPPQRFLPYLSWPDIAALSDRENTVIVQPLGTVEQHGPHLPLLTDALIASGVIGGALARLDARIPAYALPVLCYGRSCEHAHFPGTVALGAETLLHLLLEVGDWVHQAGFRKLVFANGHGGQPQVVEIAARDLRLRHPDMSVFPLSIWKVPNPAASLMSARELAEGIHAGEAETSLMLALAPERVRMDLARAEYPKHPQGLLSVEGDLPFAWIVSDLSHSGVIGDPLGASADKGQILLDALTQGWADLLGEIHAFRQPNTRQRVEP